MNHISESCAVHEVIAVAPPIRATAIIHIIIFLNIKSFFYALSAGGVGARLYSIAEIGSTLKPI